MNHDMENKSDENNSVLLDENIFVFSCLNARSIMNKTTALVDLFDETNLSVSIITETWLTNNEAVAQRTEDLQYGEDISLIRKDRAGKRGGGVAIAFNN